ncbi:ATP-binding cassette sub-family B member mitochondrial [Micractinium conductrix]|uniref:ATP-binding cassette sub-family B member mitochondrial n=1 Tax=Micractinium conductrix TaxID=554055 RepID=A0A2P6V2U2_9CHLO|nr:ATP-binding cassette sub-family B member mitochondrial [Micractinium conductrix]|eukprot:PSC68384.1 ATP-binding cassette sub-family B member mitochondrial [Micractinium conductrix]
MAFTEQTALWALLTAVCAVWAAIAVRQAQLTAARRQWWLQPGARWLAASAAWVSAALLGHAARMALRSQLADAARGGDGLPDVLATTLCAVLLVLHWAWRNNARLWLLATPASTAAVLDIGALVDAVQAYRAEQQLHPGKDSGAGLAAHYEAAALGLAAVDAAALGAATLCLLAAALAAGGGGAASGAHEPLLGTRRKRGDQWDGSRRMRLIRGTMRYVVPDTLPLKLRLGACFLLLLLGRVVNLALPLSYKKVIDRLAETGTAAAAAAAAAAAGEGGSGGGGALQALCLSLRDQAGPTFRDVFLPWVLAYLVLTFLQGSSGKGGIGFLSNLRDLLWIPLQQRACRRVSLDVFSHLLQLDHAYHLQRNTGKVMRILDRGTSSIQDVMSVVLFSVIPQLVDVLAACTYMAARLQPWTAIIVACTVLTYIPVTFLITEWRGKVRKLMNRLDNEKEGKATDLLLNYETVKLFANERFELCTYSAAIDAFQGQEYLQNAAICLLNIAQSILVFVGLAMGLVVCVRGIVKGALTVGDVVLFLSLMSQLVAPLAFFGSYYRQIQKGLIDMENMFELMSTKPSVTDAPGAPRLAVTNGALAFDNVTFSYATGAPVLRNISFDLPGGRTLALVGATGSGKSTLVRLLVRFYDPTAGRVLIDGADVTAVTLHSLRSAIAVVPQDCVLFNESIRYNIRYGRPYASDGEVEAASRVAHIHEAITRRFPEGYETVVGERGLRLSGGEKQRVAFARAVLRRPKILVLDEGTSALDSLTERMIQESVAGLRQQCTTILVAHRLSTVADADLILVFDGGSVAEAGSHAELLQRGGLYAAMWQRQLEGASFSQQQEVVAAAAAAVASVGPSAGGRSGGGPSGSDEDEDDREEDGRRRCLRRATSHGLSEAQEAAEEEDEVEEEEELGEEESGGTGGARLPRR